MWQYNPNYTQETPWLLKVWKLESWMVAKKVQNIGTEKENKEIETDSTRRSLFLQTLTQLPLVTEVTSCRLNCYLWNPLLQRWAKSLSSSHNSPFMLSCQRGWQLRWCYFIDSLAKTDCWKSTRQKPNPRKFAVLESKYINVLDIKLFEMWLCIKSHQRQEARSSKKGESCCCYVNWSS